MIQELRGLRFSKPLHIFLQEQVSLLEAVKNCKNLSLLLELLVICPRNWDYKFLSNVAIEALVKLQQYVPVSYYPQFENYYEKLFAQHNVLSSENIESYSISIFSELKDAEEVGLIMLPYWSDKEINRDSPFYVGSLFPAQSILLGMYYIVRLLNGAGFANSCFARAIAAIIITEHLHKYEFGTKAPAYICPGYYDFEVIKNSSLFPDEILSLCKNRFLEVI